MRWRWRQSTEEGFEIVRRRLFEPLVEKSHFVARDSVARSFFDLYRTQHQEFPPECRDSDYENRLKAAYPIHPEVFDRLYTDWSTLVRFQRTRGVLRLMAAVIHSLWEKGDRNPLIMPSNIPIDDPRVRDELTRYLPDQWKPIIEKDVDGSNALPLRIDGKVPNLGKFAATRRVAIYLGSAPTSSAANRGIEDRHIKLGCVMPGEAPAVFGDALRRLSAAATFLYQDGPRYLPVPADVAGVTRSDERDVAGNAGHGSEHDRAVELEPVENLGGRPSLYSDDFPEQVRRLTGLGLPLTERQLARFFGVHGSTIRRWKAQKPEFCAAVERGRLLFDIEVAERLYELATGTYQWVDEQAVVCKDVVYDDNGNKLRETERAEVVKVVKRLPPNFSAQQFWLKNHQPEYWSEKQRQLRDESAKPQDDLLAALKARLPKLP